MDKKPLYFSVDSETYKQHKAELLNSQVDFLNSLKHVYTINNLKKEKLQLKMKLYRLFSELSEDLENFEKKFPKVEEQQKKTENLKPLKPLVRQLKQKQEQQKPKPTSKKKTLDDELLEVQEKLKKLSGN